MLEISRALAGFKLGNEYLGHKLALALIGGDLLEAGPEIVHCDLADAVFRTVDLDFCVHCQQDRAAVAGRRCVAYAADHGALAAHLIGADIVRCLRHCRHFVEHYGRRLNVEQLGVRTDVQAFALDEFKSRLFRNALEVDNGFHAARHELGDLQDNIGTTAHYDTFAAHGNHQLGCFLI